jgi:hypothetical protein
LRSGHWESVQERSGRPSPANCKDGLIRCQVVPECSNYPAKG